MQQMPPNESDATDDALLELDAMRTVAQALQSIAPSSRQRVLRWAMDRFLSVSSAATTALVKPEHSEPTFITSGPAESLRLRSDTLADLYASCDPRTDADKTLVVSYWLQEVESAAGIDAQRVNSELKHLGHGVGNITRAFERLKDSRPQLMIQTKKAGSSKQARKTYRVTTEGKRYVQNLMSKSTPD